MVAVADPVPETISRAVTVAGWPGIVLPQRRICGYRLYPVVEVDEAVWQQRLAQGQGPEYVLSTLYLWESWSADLGPMPPAPALSIVGLVSQHRPADARRALCLCGALGSGLMVSAHHRRPGATTVMEADLADLSLVWAPSDRPAQVLVQGRCGPVATSRRSHITRYFEELLFGWALHAFEPQTYAPPSRLPLD